MAENTPKIHKDLTIKDCTLAVPVGNGGMGVGVSLAPLAAAVANEGGYGTISSAGLDLIVSKRVGRRVNHYEAMRLEVEMARSLSSKGVIAVNIMWALQKSYVDSVRGAIDAGADMIISGAGLPAGLPGIQNPKRTALVPIVSSARALKIICEKWEKLGYRPDAVVLEGPKAGGHLGFKFEEIDNPNFSLENLFPAVKEVAMKYGDFPIIVAGGIWDKNDVVNALSMGASGVQMGTRFLATFESGASEAYKQAVIAASQEDIIVATNLQSPCFMPFRIIKQSPMYQIGNLSPCNKGHVMQKDANGQLAKCLAKDCPDKYFCICNGLFNSAGYQKDPSQNLYTVGTNAWRVTETVLAKTIMDDVKPW
ncbi:MAG: nitronate monooxygenase [Candidatus Falkowbacteria bacterium]